MFSHVAKKKSFTYFFNINKMDTCEAIPNKEFTVIDAGAHLAQILGTNPCEQ